MHGGSIMETAQVIWGMDAKILATAIMMLSYVALFTETLNRAVVALIGASVMIFAGVLTQQQAIMGVDLTPWLF